MKKEKGITLIALVITIVVLIILSSVGIYLTLGNNGILNKAKEAKNETLKQAATEKMNLKITNMQIETYGEEQRMPTLQEFADGLCEDDEIQYVQLQSKKVGSLSKIEVGEAESIFTKLKKYPYEFEINSSLQLASIDGVQVATVPTNDEDTIVSMTKAELKELISSEINSKLESSSVTGIEAGTYTFSTLGAKTHGYGLLFNMNVPSNANITFTKVEVKSISSSTTNTYSNNVQLISSFGDQRTYNINDNNYSEGALGLVTVTFNLSY